MAALVTSAVLAPGAVAQDTSISGTVTLWYLEDPEFTFLPALKAEFEAAYPGTTVEMTEIPEDGFVTKVDTAILAGQPPDVAFVYEPRWIKAGAVMPLDEVIAEKGIDLSTFNQTAMSECTYEGKVYCLGSLGGSVLLLYNKTLFDEAGVAHPSSTEAMTVDEYAALARQLAKPSDDPATNVFGATAEVPFWWSARTTTFSEDGRTIEGYVNDADTVHMYDVLASLARDGIAPGPAQAELAGASDMLGAGDVYMGITDMEYGAGLMETAGYEWGAAPPPIEVEGATPWAFVGTDKYGAFTQGANPEAAKALVAFIGSEGSRIRAEVSDDPPLDSRYLEQWAGDNAGRQQVAEVMTAFTAPTPLIPGFWDVTAPLGDLYTLMINGEGTPQELLDEDAPAMQEALDQAWETWEAIQ
jgi:multiple sugar transport system substrate-binding protein